MLTTVDLNPNSTILSNSQQANVGCAKVFALQSNNNKSLFGSDVLSSKTPVACLKSGKSTIRSND